MKFTHIEKMEDDSYMLYFDDDFYKHFTKYYVKSSYSNILYRIFGLLPQDFYHYVGTTYNAHFKPSPYIKTSIRMLFKDKKDAIKFANEVDRRLEQVVKREDFN